MPTRRPALAGFLLLLLVAPIAPAATLYVDSASASPGAPFATLATAAHSIQEAIEAATDGDRILVAAGTYATGSTLVDGQATRVAITKAVSVESLAGAANTIIQGALPAGDAAIRGVYVGANAVLRGFTVKDAATAFTGDNLFRRSGGGIRSEATGLVRDCLITNCRATYGGGGVVGGTVQDSTLSSNFASSVGGGAWQATLQRCQVNYNNGANGGGANACTLSDSFLIGNFAPGTGAGAHTCTLTNCTVTANSALTSPSGVRDCLCRNSIIFGNAPAGPTANYVGGTFDHCCTTPLPPGTGNIASDPLLQAANGYRIALASPCRDAGDGGLVSSPTDAYGNPRLAQASVDLGAYEINLTVTNANDAGLGSLRRTLADFASSPETPVITFASDLAGQTITLSSGPLVIQQSGGFVIDATGLASRPVLVAAAGARLLELTGGTLTLRGLRLTGGTAPNPGGGALYQSGGNSVIEDCSFDNHVARSGGAIFHSQGAMTVTRCTFTANRATYAGGASNGGGAIAAFSVGAFAASDCVFQSNTADVSGGSSATVAWGGAITFGGPWSLARCSFLGNTADLGGALGSAGQFAQGSATACTFSGNTGRRFGGAIQNNASLSLTRCTLQGNTAPQGGAVENVGAPLTLTHCTVFGNFGNDYPGIDSQQGNAQLTLAYTIVAGHSSYDVLSLSSATLVGTNIVQNPFFITPPSGSGTVLTVPAGLGPLGNYGGPTQTMPLAADSPAREAGNGSTSLTDQRGYPILGVPDLGAYESGTYSDFTVWIFEKLPAAATLAEHDAAFDFDLDGQSNFEEWLALSDPNRAGSRFTAAAQINAGSPTISFSSAAGRVYRLQQSDTLLGWIDAPIAPLAGDGSLRSFVLPAPGVPKRFYRVAASLP